MGRSGAAIRFLRLRGGLPVALVAGLFAFLNTDMHSPPRYDGAGYAILGQSLASGRGYREIDRPEAPRHAHFPPGYPAMLAGLWTLTGGRSVLAAHWLSIVCTAAAAGLAWRWFRTMKSPLVAFLLGLALAVNWTWARVGGSIQSEPLFLLLEIIVWLLATGVARRGGIGAACALGAALAACTLVRHVGVALQAALLAHLLLSGRRKEAVLMSAVFIASLTPWALWLSSVPAPNQAGLIPSQGLPALIASQALFYLQRIPDQWVGPIVEIGTVFRKESWLGAVVNTWAIAATGLITFGWLSGLTNSRSRLASLAGFATLALLLVWPFTEAGRFLIPLVPCLLIGAHQGLVRSASLLEWRHPTRAAALLVLALSLPYPLYSIATGRAHAQRLTNLSLDSACAWLNRNSARTGPVLTRHPGEVYWQTHRHAVSPETDDASGIAHAIKRWGVVYLLSDSRYANAPLSPIARYVSENPSKVHEVWSRDDGRSLIQIYEVLDDQGASNLSTP